MCLPISVCQPGLSKSVLDQLLTELCCSKSRPRRCVCLPSTARDGIWPGYTHGAKRSGGFIADCCPGSPPRLQPQRGADGDGRAPKSSRFHLSHLPIKCTVSSTTSQQPKKPPSITPSLGSNLGRLRGAQPPPSASSWRIGRPQAWFWRRFFGGALSGLVPYLPVHVAEHRVGAPPAEPARWLQFLWLLQRPGKSSWLDAGAGRTRVSLRIRQKT